MIGRLTIIELLCIKLSQSLLSWNFYLHKPKTLVNYYSLTIFLRIWHISTKYNLECRHAKLVRYYVECWAYIKMNKTGFLSPRKKHGSAPPNTTQFWKYWTQFGVYIPSLFFSVIVSLFLTGFGACHICNFLYCFFLNLTCCFPCCDIIFMRVFNKCVMDSKGI